MPQAVGIAAGYRSFTSLQNCRDASDSSAAASSNQFGRTVSCGRRLFKSASRIELDEISDFELQPARIFVALSFVGFGALAIVFLILYLYTLHPELSAVEQIREYWYQYTWSVSLGVTGMLMLGREAMRSRNRDRQ
jgi:hypothetical protein